MLLAPIGNPEPKGLHPSGHLHFSSHGGTQTVKMQFATGAKKNKRRHLRQVREDANLPFGADNLKLDMVQFQIISLCCGRKNTKTAMRFFIALKMHYESYPQVKSVTVITQKNLDLTI